MNTVLDRIALKLDNIAIKHKPVNKVLSVIADLVLPKTEAQALCWVCLDEKCLNCENHHVWEYRKKYDACGALGVQCDTANSSCNYRVHIAGDAC